VTGSPLQAAVGGQGCSLTGDCSLSAPTHSSVGWQIVGRKCVNSGRQRGRARILDNVFGPLTLARTSARPGL